MCAYRLKKRKGKFGFVRLIDGAHLELKTEMFDRFGDDGQVF